ncbi:hypothetical protein GWI33_016330 [Rhynchophorus ferrugineus]|uniref:Uncharacterized protein n=1 Tax=Rhynchophorus ferrugineus TaxID=354439 RepID=A0A834M537_RHYFE|nr:hypothetical protein GWI33_016330 [Rhynchophorus ferrugineus]
MEKLHFLRLHSPPPFCPGLPPVPVAAAASPRVPSPSPSSSSFSRLSPLDHTIQSCATSRLSLILPSAIPLIRNTSARAKSSWRIATHVTAATALWGGLKGGGGRPVSVGAVRTKDASSSQSALDIPAARREARPRTSTVPTPRRAEPVWPPAVVNDDDDDAAASRSANTPAASSLPPPAAGYGAIDGRELTAPHTLFIARRPCIEPTDPCSIYTTATTPPPSSLRPAGDTDRRSERPREREKGFSGTVPLLMFMLV